MRDDVLGDRSSHVFLRNGDAIGPSALTKIDPPVLAKSDPGSAGSHVVQSDHELQSTSLASAGRFQAKFFARSVSHGALFRHFSRSL